MKTRLAAMLLVVLALSLEGCGAGPTEPGLPVVTPETPTPVVTTPPSTTPTPCRNPKFPCES